MPVPVLTARGAAWVDKLGNTSCLEALLVDDGRTRFIILLLGNPHPLKNGEGSKDGASDPCTVFPLRKSNDLDIYCWRSNSCDLFLHPVSDAWEHCATSTQHNVSIQISSEVCRTTHDGVVADLVDPSRCHAQEGWLEESLGASESLIADGDHLTIRKLTTLLQAGARGSCLHLLLKV